MPSEKYLQLLDFSDEELQNELRDTQNQYQTLQFDHAIKGLDNPLRLKEVRKDIARLKTEIRKRELNQLSEEAVNGRSRIRARRRK